jgi:DNA-binding response OmpR family regulator
MKSILIVEDDHILLKTMESLLSIRGHEIAIAKDGKEALDKISRHHYDLVLTDLMLPYSNGLEIISKLNTGDKKTAVVIMSAASTEESIEDGFAIGADDYIRKPFTPSELMLRVNRLLK